MSDDSTPVMRLVESFVRAAKSDAQHALKLANSAQTRLQDLSDDERIRLANVIEHLRAAGAELEKALAHNMSNVGHRQ